MSNFSLNKACETFKLMGSFSAIHTSHTVFSDSNPDCTNYYLCLDVRDQHYLKFSVVFTVYFEVSALYPCIFSLFIFAHFTGLQIM